MNILKQEVPQQSEKSVEKFVHRMQSVNFLRWPWPPWAAALQAAKNKQRRVLPPRSRPITPIFVLDSRHHISLLKLVQNTSGALSWIMIDG